MLPALALAFALQAPAPRAILIRDITVIDGTGARPRGHHDILIRDGKIAEVVRTGTASPADSVIDGYGLYAIPGLIDAHVHLGTGSRDTQLSALKATLAGGVTSVFDMASDTRVVGPLQKQIDSGELPGPHIYYIALFGGPAFFTDPRAAQASQGFAPGTAPFMKAIVDTTDLAAAVSAAKATGAIAIKLYAALDSAMVTRATAEAKRQGMKVIAHATTFPGLPSDLAAAGVDILAHAPYLVWQGSPRTSDFPSRARGDFLGVSVNGKEMETLLYQMRDKHVALNPTFFVFEAQAKDSVAAVRTPWMYQITKRAFNLGVRLVAGTDGMYNAQRDSMPGIHRELELMVTGAGFSPVQAIQSATQGGAWAIGKAATHGTIEAGKNADLVILRKDPTADIRNTRAIKMVMQDGRVVAR